MSAATVALGCRDSDATVAANSNLDQDTSISDATPVSQGDLAIVVAVRELVYIAVCLLAACLCPYVSAFAQDRHV